MNRILKAILTGLFVAIVVFIIDVTSPYKNIEYERLLNMLTIVGLTVIFSILILKVNNKDKK